MNEPLPMTFKERIFKQMKLMNILDNSVLCHTIEKDFTNIENKEEQWSVVMTEMFDYFSHQYQLYIAALSTTTGKYSTPRPPSPHNIEVLKHTVPFIEEFKEDFHCLSHINSLGENGFLEPLVAMTRCVLALIFSNEDVDKKLFFDAMTSLLYIFNQLFITDDNVKLFLKDFSNIYPTVILKFRELEDVSPSTTEIAEKIIEKVYTLAKSIDMNSPFVRTLKALRQLKKRTNTNPTTGSTYNNTNNNSIINSNSIVGRGSIGNGKNGMAYQFAPINSNTSPYRTPSSAVNYGVNNAANMKPLNLDDVKLNSSTGGAGIDDNNLPSAVTHKVSNEAKNLDDIEKQITEIQLQQCQISLNNFELIRFIGKGGCGTVFLAKAKNLPGGETYLALKVIDQSDFEVQKRLQRYKIERNLMVLISNPFIITLHYAFITSNYLYLALQYCNGGDLYHYLSRMPNYRISENDARFYASEVLLALECLHAYNYMYRDLKPENILISHTGHIVLGDFDLSMSTDINNDNKLNLTGEKSLVGTLEYISPEVAQGLEYDERTDWWSFGILIYEMIYGKVPFEGQGHELLVNICNDDIPFPYLSKKCFTHKSVSNAMKDIVTKLLDKNHEERLSDPDIIKNHPFFQKIDFENILTMVPPYVPPPEVPEEYTKSRIDIHDEGLPRKSDTFIRIDGMWSTVALDTPPTRQNRKLKQSRMNTEKKKNLNEKKNEMEEIKEENKTKEQAENENTEAIEVSESDPNIVKKDDFVILIGSDHKELCIQVNSKATANINKKHIKINKIIGCKYGSVFEVVNGNIQPTNEPLFPKIEEAIKEEGDEEGKAMEEEDNDEEKEENADNRDLVDDNTSQTLTTEQIKKLQEEGISGNKLIEKLCENSKTFDKKTKFSKEKYIKKKQLKYITRIMVVKCTSMSVCHQLFLKNPLKINNLRPDALGRILSLCSTIPESNILIMEDSMGIITGSICERTGGMVNIYCLYDKENPCYDGIRRFNFSNEMKKAFKYVPLKFLTSKNIEEFIPKVSTDRVLTEENKQKIKERDESKRVFYSNVLTLMNNNSFDTVLICVESDPIPIAELLLEFLSPSKRFIIYSHFIENLTKIYGALHNGGCFINLELYESFYRNIQVLPQRTHPEMLMDNRSGYILTGIKVIPNETMTKRKIEKIEDENEEESNKKAKTE